MALGNGLDGGDCLPVVVPWMPPDAFDGVSLDHLRQVQAGIAEGDWRTSDQVRKGRWAGELVAAVLACDLARKADKARVKGVLRQWTDNGALKIEKRPDEDRIDRPYYAVGKWADE